jgi:peroxiredoxin
MVELGTAMPAFTLPDVTTGELMSLDSLYADSPPPKALVVVFLAAHCPFVKHIAGELSKLSADISSGKFGPVKMVGISSNFVGTHPDDAPERMAEEIKSRRYQFPILYDETQEVARAWQAACTPDFYLLDHERKLFYRGRLDASRPGNNIPVTGEDLRNAIQLCVNGQAPPGNQLPSIGCSIKWKPS